MRVIWIGFHDVDYDLVSRITVYVVGIGVFGERFLSTEFPSDFFFLHDLETTKLRCLSESMLFAAARIKILISIPVI